MLLKYKENKTKQKRKYGMDLIITLKVYLGIPMVCNEWSIILYFVMVVPNLYLSIYLC